ncbi:nuclear pore complex protein NUP88 [Impatiens glandulifera]|uniref:nuclear pore complex protein NUP88 n=1 Tax=Impatiens glandulifera TaxID=253017 RepID=UPI001FB195F1|nr:nuclear pore complex protein NUP88 [Impatiens glandulifera]
MRFNFDLSDAAADGDGSTLNHSSPSTTTTPEMRQVEWLPLQDHPIFASMASSYTEAASPDSSASRTIMNLMTWDGSSRLYVWDSHHHCLHRISVRLGEPHPSSVIAASPSKVLQPDVQLSFVVNKVSINRNGSAMLLIGPNGLHVMYLNANVCRTVSIGVEIYLCTNSAIRTLQISWHPYSETHVGILSSDSVFRIFDLSSSFEKPEQEYYLQPVGSKRLQTASSLCPVDFCFGGDHLWDRFSVFILFSDGSIYVLCPIAPFGSVYKWESVLELYNDAQTLGLKSSNTKAVNNSNMAIQWLEATFPELTRLATGGNSLVLKAEPYALFDATVSLQGPLPRLCNGGEDSEASAKECEGRAVSFLYNLVCKDTVLVTAWTGGQLQIHALADEIQPVWLHGNPPHLNVDFFDRILGIAMICESVPDKKLTVKLHQQSQDTVWSGQPPPLLRLAMVDLALPKNRGSSSTISMFVDPLIPERMYSVHGGGIDSIVLHFLPFTNQATGKDEGMRTPSVHPILSTCKGGSSVHAPLCGFIALWDSFGYSWIAALTPARECVVLEMRTWDILLPLHVDGEERNRSEESKETDVSFLISKELLGGPRTILLPSVSPNLPSITADSIEGRSKLHQYFKLFHENYVEYAHKVYFELKHHGPQVKKTIEDLQGRLSKAQHNILKVEEKQEKLDSRIDMAIQAHVKLEERLLSLRNLPGILKKPLSKAERDFKFELDQFSGVELDAVRSSVEALNGRLNRYKSSLRRNPSTVQQRLLSGRRKNQALDDQISSLRSSITKLSLLNNENTEKVKLIDSTIIDREKKSIE